MTGYSGRGIGKAIALAFAEAGANLGLVSRTESQLKEVSDKIKESFPSCEVVYVAVDVTDATAVASCVKEIESKLGKLDVVVPNAGVNMFRPFVDTPIDEWWKVMDVNVRAPLVLSQLVLKSMRERNEGAIIYISSRAGIVNLGELSPEYLHCTS